MGRKQEIINVIVNDFNTIGFNLDFTMSELAERVNIGKSTIYEYFKNKDEIIREALFEYINIGILEVSKVELGELGFEKGFKEQMKVLLGFAKKSRSILDTLRPGFVQKLPDSVRGEMKNKMEDLRAKLQLRFATFFEKGLTEGVVTNVTPTNALVVTSVVIGSIMVFSERDNIIDIEVFINEIYDSLLKILN